MIKKKEIDQYRLCLSIDSNHLLLSNKNHLKIPLRLISTMSHLHFLTHSALSSPNFFMIVTRHLIPNTKTRVLSQLI